MDAVSHYRVLEAFGAASLLEVRLETGKRNQIRIRRACGATRWSGSGGTCTGPTSSARSSSSGRRFTRHRLAFEHPASGELRLEAPIPPDFDDLLTRLRSQK